MLLHEHVERLADSAPDAVVLTTGREALTAAQLDRFANSIAWSLLDSGVSRGDLVAVALPRNIALVPALLGVLKCGAAYVPVDPHLPAIRIEFMLDDAGARHVLVDSGSAHTAPYAHRRCLDPHGLSGDQTRPRVELGGADAAYVIYTSGTTGRPKGVVVEHRNVDNLVRGWSTAIPFPAGATMSSLATVAFDIFLAETLIPMTYGLRVALATDEDVASPAAIACFLAREEVTVMQVTPSRLSWLLADDAVASELGRVDLIIVGGEAFPPTLLEQARKHTDAAIYNVYGPTEATVWTSAKLLAADVPITIGPPIPGVTYHLIAESGREPAPGELGELCIGGDALARGYLGDPTRTRDRFGTGERRYRTGDLARRRLDNGELQLVGRADQQIKIDGYRVELTEVEAVLAATAGVREAVVLPLDGGVSRTLAAVLTPASADVEVVWARAIEHLPRYMMPSTLIAVAALPLSPAGKADRSAIEALLREHIGAATRYDPLDYLCTMVARWLGGSADPDTAGLIDLGVGSLNTARLTAEIASRYGVRLDLSDVITAPSLRHLADLIRQHRPYPVGLRLDDTHDDVLGHTHGPREAPR